MSGRRLLVINPNTNAAITARLCAEVARHAPEAVVTGRTATFGFPVIATRASFAIAAHAALDAFAAHQGAVDTVILGCFGDPGLAALREIAGVPVVGLAEASFAAADGPFAVVTAGPAWVGMLEEQIALSPQAALCRGVLALEATGADVARDPAGFVAGLDLLVARAVAAGAASVILGGAVLAGFAPRLRPVVRFIDCVQAATRRSCPAGAVAAQPGPSSGLAPNLAAALARQSGLRQDSTARNPSRSAV